MVSPFGKRRFEIFPEPGWVHVRWVEPEKKEAKNGKELVLLPGTREEIVQEMRCIAEVVLAGEKKDPSERDLLAGMHVLVAPLSKGMPIPWCEDESEFLLERFCIIAVLGKEERALSIVA